MAHHREGCLVVSSNTRKQLQKAHSACTLGRKLCEAIENENDSLALQILQRNVDLTTFSPEGWTPLTLACQKGRYSIVEAIVNKQIEEYSNSSNDSASHRSITHPLDATNDNGDSPLICAARGGYSDVCSLLLDNGADINQCSVFLNQSPLLVAVDEGSYEVVDILLEAGANGHLADNIHMTPLYVAVKNQNEAIAKRLLDEGCDPNIGSQDHTPLFLAARIRALNIAKLLVEAGCQINLQNKYGVTPLYEAAFRGNADIVEYLLSLTDIKVNAYDMYLKTPLIVAAMNGHLDCVQLLYHGGAMVHWPDDDRNTAIQVAFKFGRISVLEFFLDQNIPLLLDQCNHMNMFCWSDISSSQADTLKVLIKNCTNLPLHVLIYSSWGNQANLELIYLSGNGNCLNVDDLEPHSRSAEVANWIAKFSKMHDKPLSLKEICRISIRRCMEDMILYKCNKLPLPRCLKDYICMKNEN